MGMNCVHSFLLAHRFANIYHIIALNAHTWANTHTHTHTTHAHSLQRADNDELVDQSTAEGSACMERPEPATVWLRHLTSTVVLLSDSVFLVALLYCPKCSYSVPARPRHLRNMSCWCDVSGAVLPPPPPRNGLWAGVCVCGVVITYAFGTRQRACASRKKVFASRTDGWCSARVTRLCL